MLTPLLSDIETFLSKHLKKYPYVLAVTIKDHIELLFEEKFKEDGKLKTVMSMMCGGGELGKYLLKREVNKWGVVCEGYVCYTMVPPWVGYSGKVGEVSGSTAEITKLLN